MLSVRNTRTTVMVELFLTLSKLPPKKATAPRVAEPLPRLLVSDKENDTPMTKIEQIKQYHNLPAYAARLCGGLKKSGHSRRYLVGYCPFCQPNPVKGKRPRFWVDTELQLSGCFKCRMTPMDIINLYAAINHLDNLTAVADLYLLGQPGSPSTGRGEPKTPEVLG